VPTKLIISNRQQIMYFVSYAPVHDIIKELQNNLVRAAISVVQFLDMMGRMHFVVHVPRPLMQGTCIFMRKVYLKPRHCQEDAITIVL
jgi:hypothetical protein